MRGSERSAGASEESDSVYLKLCCRQSWRALFWCSRSAWTLWCLSGCVHRPPRACPCTKVPASEILAVASGTANRCSGQRTAMLSSAIARLACWGVRASCCAAVLTPSAEKRPPSCVKLAEIIS